MLSAIEIVTLAGLLAVIVAAGSIAGLSLWVVLDARAKRLHRPVPSWWWDRPGFGE